MTATKQPTIRQKSRGESLVKLLWIFALITVLVPLVVNIFTGVLIIAGYNPGADGVLIREMKASQQGMSPMVKLVEPLKTKYVLAMKGRSSFLDRRSQSSNSSQAGPANEKQIGVTGSNHSENLVETNPRALTLPAAQRMYQMDSFGTLVRVEKPVPLIVRMRSVPTLKEKIQAIIEEEAFIALEKSADEPLLSAREFVQKLIQKSYEEKGVESDIFDRSKDN